MTNFLAAQEFFSLDSFAHKALFCEGKDVFDALRNLNKYLTSSVLGVIEVDVLEGVYLVNPEQISIGAGTVIEPGVLIQGPCIIGKNCHIRQGAYIRGDVITGDRCVIGHDTEVKHSIFLDDAMAAHFNYVGDSIIGNGVNLGAGVKCANLRLDHENVVVFIDGKRIETGLKKLGAVVGDGAQIGCNCVTDPGTLLGKNSICYPCLNVHGYVPKNGKVKPGLKNIVE